MNVKPVVKNIEAFFKQNGHKILHYVGLAGTAGGGVWLGTKIPGTVERVRECKTMLKEFDSQNLPEDILKKEKKKEILSCLKYSLKECAVPATVFAAGIFGNACGFRMSEKRTGSVIAAYAALKKSYDNYRERVIEKVGEEQEKDIYENLEDTVQKDESGKKKVHVKKSGCLPNTYARYFDKKDSKAAVDNYEFDMAYIAAHRDIAQALLEANGYLFLNELYELFGYGKSADGQVVGWVYDRKHPTYIELNPTSVLRECEDGPEVLESVIMIDPNVQGPIIDKALAMQLLDE